MRGQLLHCVLPSLAIFLFGALAQRAASQTPGRTLITDVYIISPESLDRVEKGSVLIENGHIVRVERGIQSAIKPANATVVPGGGRFLIPGLIDSHVHLAFVPGVRPEVSFGPLESRPAMVGGYFKQLPRSYLYFGYTTRRTRANARAVRDFISLERECCARYKYRARSRNDMLDLEITGQGTDVYHLQTFYHGLARRPE
jgi:hypothetical protein